MNQLYPKLALKIGIVFSLAIPSQFVLGQNRTVTDAMLNKSTMEKMVFADTLRNCEAMDAWFKQDVASNTVFLFLQGGIAPRIYTNDKDFERKYKVFIKDFRCSGPDDKCIVRYNTNCFNYLTSLYGKKWIKEIRKDIIGLAEWKKQSKN